MNYQQQTLPSGLRVLTVPLPDLESVTVTVWVKTGSRNETKKTSGISHFLEHMVFKGSVKRPSAKQISEAVDAIGGEFNAATAKDWTNFYIKVAVKHLETAFDVLADMVLNPLLQEEEIEREKGTILQEIAMYEDTPLMHISDVFENVIFTGNSLGWDTAGSPTTVKAIGQADFLSYRKRYYYPQNILVTVAGGVTASKALALVKKYFGEVGRQKGKGQPAFPKFTAVQTEPQVKLVTKKTDQAHLILGFRGDGRDYAGRYAQGLLATILGGGMSSRLFLEIRERRGLAYSVKTSYERYQEVGYMDTYAGVNIKKVDLALRVILTEHQKLVAKGLTIKNAELSKAKEYLKGHFVLALEDTRAVSALYADQALFLPKIETPEAILQKVDQVTTAEVQYEARRLFKPDRLNLAIIGPFSNPEKFVKILS